MARASSLSTGARHLHRSPTFSSVPRLRNWRSAPSQKIGALNGLAEHRRAAQWQVETVRESDDLFASVENSPAVPLRMMNPVERVRADYTGTSLTTGPHPMALLCAKVPHLWRATDLGQARHGERVTISGMVICRQRPGTSDGFVFVSMEDETGAANAIVTPQLYEECRLVIGEEKFLAIEGIVQNAERVIHVKAERVTPLAFGELPAAASHDFHRDGYGTPFCSQRRGEKIRLLPTE